MKIQGRNSQLVFYQFVYRRCVSLNQIIVVLKSSAILENNVADCCIQAIEILSLRSARGQDEEVWFRDISFGDRCVRVGKLVSCQPFFAAGEFR